MIEPLKLKQLRELATASRDAALAYEANDTLDAHNASEKADIALTQAFPTAETFIALLDHISQVEAGFMREVERTSRCWHMLSDEQRARIDH